MSAVIPQVAIIMGSDSDLPIMKDAAVVLKNGLEITFVENFELSLDILFNTVSVCIKKFTGNYCFGTPDP